LTVEGVKKVFLAISSLVRPTAAQVWIEPRKNGDSSQPFLRLASIGARIARDMVVVDSIRGSNGGRVKLARFGLRLLRSNCSIMIWGAIFGGSRSEIVIMEKDEGAPKGGYTANSYLTVLREQLPICWEPGMTFMQDNARIHTAGKVKTYLEDEGTPTLDWPPYSPDLNLIEHVWAALKKWITRNKPELSEMGQSEEAYQALFSAIREAWEAIGQEVIDDLIKSMEARVKAVIKAKGWYTKY